MQEVSSLPGSEFFQATASILGWPGELVRQQKASLQAAFWGGTSWRAGEAGAFQWMCHWTVNDLLPFNENFSKVDCVRGQ